MISTKSGTISDENLIVYFNKNSKHQADIWGIKYLFDKGLGYSSTTITVCGKISNSMALRMYYLKYLFQNIKFHDNDHDNYIFIAEEIIQKIGSKYITYSDKFPGRGVKDKPESRVELDLSNNLHKYLDFTTEVPFIRQFPANIFDGEIKEERRKTNKLWIDIVSVNSELELSPIELKVGGNIPLDLFAQGLDYGIFCYLYRKHLMDNWFKGCPQISANKVTIYYVGEKFHPALVGRGLEKGIVDLIRENPFFNIVFKKINIDKSSYKIIGSENVYDSRNG